MQFDDEFYRSRHGFISRVRHWFSSESGECDSTRTRQILSLSQNGLWLVLLQLYASNRFPLLQILDLLRRSHVRRWLSGLRFTMLCQTRRVLSQQRYLLEQSDSSEVGHLWHSKCDNIRFHIDCEFANINRCEKLIIRNLEINRRIFS